MSALQRRARTRVVGVIGAAWGAELIANTPALFEWVAGRVPDRTELLLARVLGVRHLGQAVAQVLAPGRRVRLLAAVDLIHAASMAAVAVVSPRERRVALTSSAAAATLAVIGLRADRRQGS